MFTRLSFRNKKKIPLDCIFTNLATVSLTTNTLKYRTRAVFSHKFSLLQHAAYMNLSGYYAMLITILGSRLV